LSEPKQIGSQHKVASQIKGLLGFLSAQSLGFGLTLLRRQSTQINQRYFQWRKGLDHLHRTAFDRFNASAQDFVTSKHLVHRPAYRSDIQLTFESKPGRQVIGGTIGLQLIEKPQSLLVKGKGGRTLVDTPSNLFVLNPTSRRLQPLL
jgi:hypothetical protein